VLAEADCWASIKHIFLRGTDLMTPRTSHLGYVPLDDTEVETSGLHPQWPWTMMLTRTIQNWLPLLPDKINFSIKTYPILVHGVPFNIETSHDSSDIATLLTTNEDTISHP